MSILLCRFRLGGVMMERLTEKVFGFVQLKACGNDFCKETCAEHDEEKSCKNCHIQKAFDKLAEYEDLDEQGLLLRLPCRIGDVVYAVTRDFISEYTICSIEKYNEWIFFNWICEKGMYVNLRGFTEYEIGKTVFLTRSEAEQKLKEMEGD